MTTLGALKGQPVVEVRVMVVFTVLSWNQSAPHARNERDWIYSLGAGRDGSGEERSAVGSSDFGIGLHSLQTGIGRASRTLKHVGGSEARDGQQGERSDDGRVHVVEVWAK